MATRGELSRLQRHPELFPSKDIRKEFWRKVHYLCNFKSVILKQEARDHAHRMLQAARVEVEEDMRSPGKDMQRSHGNNSSTTEHQALRRISHCLGKKEAFKSFRWLQPDF